MDIPASSVLVQTLGACAEHGLQWFQAEIVEPVERAGLEPPTAVAALRAPLQRLRQGLAEPSALAPELLPLLRAVALRGRRAWAETLEARAEQTHDPAVHESLAAMLGAADAMLQAEWLRTRPSPALPRLTDCLTLAAALAARERSGPRWPLPRAHDPVSRILLHARLFAPDLAHLRDRCSLRGLPLAVAGLDLDDLRAINERFGLETVDRRLLPPLLRCLEALVFGRGHAYGFGRDDYALLLPNADEAEATRILALFQARLAAIPYPGIDARPTASIGLVIADPDDPRTGLELLRDVERAKRHAKGPGGKRCIASLRADGPAVISPPEPV